MSRVAYLVLAWMMVVLPVRPVRARTIYVDLNATGQGNGMTWQDAFADLASALAVAKGGDVVRVAAGVYRPGQVRTATFAVPAGVAVDGGYAGLAGGDPDMRDPDRFRTVLSGDLSGDDQDLADPCQLWTAPERQENAFNVVTLAGSGAPVILDGLVITGGMETRTGNPRLDGGPGGGGGMVIKAGTATIEGCRFVANAGRGGAAILITGGSATFKRCLFEGNYALTEAGALACKGASVRLVDCVLSRNKAGTDGGGISVRGGGSLTCQGCMLVGNQAAGSGGAVFLHDSDAQLEHCVLAGNLAAADGGAVEIGAVRLSNQVRLSFCTITGNRSGGGVATLHYPGLLSYVVASIDHSIIWANEGLRGNCMEYRNMYADPCFAMPGRWEAGAWVDGDYHLKSQAGRWDREQETWVLDDVTSPAIDAGDPNLPVGPEPFPNGGIVNLGAYGGTGQASKSYFGGPGCQTVVAGDINGDCRVDGLDLQLLALNWLADRTERVQITWLGHAAFKIAAGLDVIYIDPYRISGSPQDATYVLCTHSHGDHFSSGDIAKVAGPAMQLVGPADVVGSYGQGMGISPGQSVDLGSVRILAVAAYNTNKPNHPRSNNWLGFMVEIAGRRIYHAGDTDLIDEMKTLGSIDVAMLPVGGTYTMNATEAAIATSYIQPKLAIPMHWGTIVGSLADAQTFAQKAACPVVVMTVGQTIEI